MKMYYMAIVLPEELNQEILEYKNYMHERYECKVGLKSPAHITIIPPFWTDEEKEQEIVNEIDRVSSATMSFDIKTDNFSSFKPRTIFIEVKNNDALDQLKKNAENYFVNKDYKIRKEDRPFHPHITIATRDLHKKAFAEAWPMFAEKEFEKTFMAKGLSLLKHNGKNWDVIHTGFFNEH